MRIYSMTATFGKLEHRTLTLNPGLNVIPAPNEWGKSTWCAFLVAMLYGIETRERSTANFLAAKDRYAPWSGAPMSGSMDICWKGRDITIERSSRGRVPMGQFTAFETATGIPVPELTEENCGQVLLGVEKSVFVRSAFIRQADMPLTNDESLRRRLNALVTTGDESGASDALAEKLKELRNGCRYNRTGLIPQAEEQQADLRNKLLQLERLQQKCRGIRSEQEGIQGEIDRLENHRAALEYAAAEEGLARVAAARNAQTVAAATLEEAAAYCEKLPTEETARETLKQLNLVQQQWNLLQAEVQPLPPTVVQPPVGFIGLSGDQAVLQAAADLEALEECSKHVNPVFLILAGVGAAAGVALGLLVKWFFSIPCGVLAAVMIALFLWKRISKNKKTENLYARYDHLDANLWLPVAEKYRDDLADYGLDNETYQAQIKDLQERRENLTRQTTELTQGLPLMTCIARWEKILVDHADLHEARRNWKRATEYADDLAAMVKPADPPAYPDNLTHTAEQTEQALAELMSQNRQLDQQFGQCEGQMQALGQRETLENQLDQVAKRIEKLEEAYTALTIAQETLAEASEVLQRRFAPKITKTAQQIFAQLTGGRYNRLMLGHDFSVSTNAQGEDTLRSGMWRSDGTIDQLYLSLRLAVSEELIPQAPLVLDDVLVRFDDDRLGLAMDILGETAEKKQVILFTCQSREQEYLAGK